MDELILSFMNENFTSVLVIGGIVALIKIIKPQILEVYKKFNDWIDLKISMSKYNELFEVGKKIWYQVEEDYKINDKIKAEFNTKVEYFNKLILNKFPNIKEEDIELIRQAISGEINLNKNK